MEFLALVALIVAVAAFVPFAAGMALQLPFGRALPWQVSWLVGLGCVLLFNLKGTTVSDVTTGPAAVFLILWWMLYGSMVDLGARLVRLLKARRARTKASRSPTWESGDRAGPERAK